MNAPKATTPKTAAPKSTPDAAQQIQAVFAEADAEAVLIGFGASWCGPWRLLGPVLDEIEAKGSKVIRVDVDQEPGLADQHVVVTLPTFITVAEGKETRRWLGAVSQTELEAGLIAKPAQRSGMRRRR